MTVTSQQLRFICESPHYMYYVYFFAIIITQSLCVNGDYLVLAFSAHFRYNVTSRNHKVHKCLHQYAQTQQAAWPKNTDKY